MAIDSEDIRERLEKDLEILKRTPIPKGFARECSDVDVLLFEYDGYVAGLVSSFLQGSQVSIKDLHVASDLEDKIRRCEKAIEETRSYKRRLDRLLADLKASR